MTKVLFQVVCLLCLVYSACGQHHGQPVDPGDLGYQTCERYHDCGPGRYCNPDGFCWADCRTTADCGLIQPGGICNLYGECVEQDFGRPCESHAGCGADGLCNGRCSSTQAVCGQASECPLDHEECLGSCAPHCGTEDDCSALGPELTCAPVGRCLLPGWERWVSPGELPPTGCSHDAACKALGWSWICNCDLVFDPLAGYARCREPAGGTCVQDTTPLDLGDGDASSSTHGLRGVWGLRVSMAVVTLGLPLLNRQTTYSTHLYLVRARHEQGDRIELDEKLCELKMINFSDTGTPPSDLIHVTIPFSFFESIPIVTRALDMPTVGPGNPWQTTQSVEVRGSRLENPATDPLPARSDFETNPADPRFWDQDADGNVGLTTLTDGVLRGEIYIVQRLRVWFEGQQLDPNRIEGLARVQTEEHIISSSKNELVYDIATEIHPDQDRTYFRMQRLPDDASCSDLIRSANQEEAWLRHTDRLSDL